MTKSRTDRATDVLLGELHGRLAKAMLAGLRKSDRAEVLLAKYQEELPEDVVEFLEDLMEVNPALLTAVTKFLKDNAITCAVEDNEELTELERQLAERKKSIKNIKTPIYDIQ